MSKHKPLDITDDSFEKEVLKSDQPVLVDFWAAWCGPCRMIAPSIKDIAEEYGEQLKVAKVDIDANPMIPGRYGIQSIPTLMVFKGGQVVERLVGAMPKERIMARVAPHLTPAQVQK